MLKNRAIFIFFALMLFAGSFAAQAGSVPVYREMVIDRGPEKSELCIRVQLAITAEERNQGLMHRTFLAEDTGMLFVFGQDQILSFWMKDTVIPLSIAFISADGRILEIQEMEPENQVPVHSSAPARYALEMNRGWFDQKGVVPGNRFRLNP
ncbi:DUF192 domain-containing protein [Desulfosarcina sp. OttesenSCG-928-A07]|nr:DUF192 domain-containing protein [Desulfosarcina sp. OttesenSCG-928-G17]MDL2328660.1 DUF192 domain-containing protein [Desulfosarcina sp. OttesenSCG-928-A07]